MDFDLWITRARDRRGEILIAPFGAFSRPTPTTAANTCWRCAARGIGAACAHAGHPDLRSFDRRCRRNVSAVAVPERRSSQAQVTGKRAGQEPARLDGVTTYRGFRHWCGVLADHPSPRHQRRGRCDDGLAAPIQQRTNQCSAS